jgi:hypothetical protein
LQNYIRAWKDDATRDFLSLSGWAKGPHHRRRAATALVLNDKLSVLNDKEVVMKAFSILFLVLLSASLIIAGLWTWQQSQDLVLDWGFGRPNIAQWAVRSAVVAAIAAAQIILLVPVIGRIYRRGVADMVIAFTAAVVLALASVSAIACGFAGR